MWPLAATAAALNALDAILLTATGSGLGALFGAVAGATGALALYLRTMR